MPGFELIGKEERDQALSIFEKSGGVLFRHGFDTQRNGVFKVKEFEKLFITDIGFSHQYKALAVSSGTAAIRVALAALDLKPGSKVLIPSFTFVATYEAVIESGLVPVAIGIDASLGIDVADLEGNIDSSVSAVICVHMLGYPCDVEKISSICKRNSLFMIEDVAWGLGAECNKQLVGTFGSVSCFSFDHAKLITTGEGGMVITKDKEIYARAAAWHDHGHENTPGLPRWRDNRRSSGFNFRMTEIQAAIGIAQLKKFTTIISFQRETFKSIELKLRKNKSIGIISRPNCFPSFDALIIGLESAEAAHKMRDFLLSQNIGTKILPEALSWHFAGDFEHLKNQIILSDSMPSLGKEHLLKCVAIPINFSDKEKLQEVIEVM